MTNRRTDRIVNTLRNAPAAPSMFRASTQLRTSVSRVDRTGGDYKAGLITGYSLITRGEALGHGTWIDSEFLDQVNAAANAAGSIKSRFTHPDMSSDGLAKFLGRTKSTERIDDQVIGDLHLAKTAHKTPDGDLAGYVMDRTEEDNESFGASIVFYPDIDAEWNFLLEHGAVEKSDEWGPYLDLTDFISPDLLNTENLPHTRLKELSASDLTDDPAANPNGFFSTGPAEQFTALADYALGITDQQPADATALGVHPDRLRGFVSRYLQQRALTLKKGTDMAAVPKFRRDNSQFADPPADPPEDAKPEGQAEGDPETTTTPGEEMPEPDEGMEETPEETPAKPDEQAAPVSQSAADDARATFAATLKDYASRFGATLGSEWAIEGKPIRDAYAAYVDHLNAEHAGALAAAEGKAAAAEAKAAELQGRLSQLGELAAGEPKPLSSVPAGEKTKSTPLSKEERAAQSLGDGASKYAAGLNLGRFSGKRIKSKPTEN